MFFTLFTQFILFTRYALIHCFHRALFTLSVLFELLYIAQTQAWMLIYIVIKLKGYWMSEYGFKSFGGKNGIEWMGQWIRKIASLLTTWEPGVLKTSTCCYHCLMSDWCPLFVANIFRQGHFGHFVTSSSRFSKISRQVTVEASQNHVVCSSCLFSSWR